MRRRNRTKEEFFRPTSLVRYRYKKCQKRHQPGKKGSAATNLHWQRIDAHSQAETSQNSWRFCIGRSSAPNPRSPLQIAWWQGASPLNVIDLRAYFFVARTKYILNSRIFCPTPPSTTRHYYGRLI